MQQQIEVPSKEFCKTETTKLKVNIVKGASDGDTVVFEYMGEQRPAAIPGHVVVRLKQKGHLRFTRDGSDLHTALDLTLTEALTGFSKTVNHLDGRKVTVSSNQVTKPSSVISLRGEGMPRTSGGSGDLHVKMQVMFPRALTPEQKQQIALILQ